ncbi:hypothetical protein RUND412_007238 [Rhizina undulata]
MAPTTRAQRRTAAKAPVPPAELLSVSTPADSLPVAVITTQPNNPRHAPIIALSSSNHSTHGLTRSEAGRLYPPPIPTPIRTPILAASTPLTVEAIAANQEILARNVAALHDRMERIENLLQEVVRAQKERAEGFRLLEEKEVELWSPRDYPRQKMKWEFADQDSAKVYGAGAESEDRARERRRKRPAVGDSPKTRMTRVLMRERKDQGKAAVVGKRKAEGDGKPVEVVKRRAGGKGAGKGAGKGKAKAE